MNPSRAEFSLASSKNRTQPSSTRRNFLAVSGYVGYIGKAVLSLLPSEFHTRRSLMAHSSQKHTEQEIPGKVVSLPKVTAESRKRNCVMGQRKMGTIN